MKRTRTVRTVPPTEKISVSMPADMLAWLRARAQTKRTTLSFAIRDLLGPAFDYASTQSTGKAR